MNLIKSNNQESGNYWKRRYYLIDHKLLFLFGFIFYLIIPYLIGISHALPDYPGMELYHGFFKRIPSNKLFAYVLISGSWLPAFYLGHFLFKLFRPYKRSIHVFPASFTSHGVTIIGIGLLLVFLLFTFISRNSIFGNYELYDAGARGKMSSLLVLFNFFLLYQLLSNQKLSFFIVSGTILTSLLLLAMGGRMYVMQTFVILLVYKTSFSPRRWGLLRVLGFGLGALIIGSWVGLFRMGFSFNPESASYSFLAEPVFTWFSTSTFLISNNIPVINFPSNFLTSFFNLVPNTIFSLQPYVISTQAMGYTYQNPLGADSVWSTYVINFGYVGSFFFVMATGFMMNLLRHLSENNRFWAVYYILVCGILPFQFFRDGFYIVNKQLFFNFLFLPALLLLLLKFIQYIQRLPPTFFFPGKNRLIEKQ